MTTIDRKEYYKLYIQRNINRIREYKRVWMHNKRHPLDDNDIFHVSEGKIDKAKDTCVLCSHFIQRKDYPRLGNFCSDCSLTCDKLSQLYPNPLWGWEGIEEDKYIQQEFRQKRNIYEKAVRIFQKRIKNKIVLHSNVNITPAKSS